MKSKEFSSIIRALRKEQGMTQAALADRLGVTDKAVSKWERGLSYPDISLFPRLADELGVTIADLLSGYADDEHPSRLLQIMRMSHDIRTPLHIMLGCADMAEIYRHDEKKLLHYLNSIHVAGEYLLQAIDYLKEVLSSQDGDFGELSVDLSKLDQDEHDRFARKEPFVQGYDFTGKRVLIAEDIPINREIMLEILTRTGAEVECAADGRICVEMVDNAPAGFYDLILMDVKMPHMDGMEATRRIREMEDQRKAKIPIIAITANAYDDDRKMALEAGMNEFTEKPIIIHKLLAAMKKHMS